MTIEAYIPKTCIFFKLLTPTNFDIEKYENAKVLELYGNAGTLLNDPDNRVKEENYTVFDSDPRSNRPKVKKIFNADFLECGIDTIK